MYESLKGQKDKMRPECKKYIEKTTMKAPYEYKVSSVEGGMWLDSLNKKFKEKFGNRMNREEWNYATERLWKVQKYTNYSGD